MYTLLLIYFYSGISREDNKEIPTDRQLAKLVRQIRWEDMYTLVIRLGLDLPEIQAFHEDYGSNHLNLAFLCLRKWRLKTNKTIKHLVYALQDVGLDIHMACKVNIKYNFLQSNNHCLVLTLI